MIESNSVTQPQTPSQGHRGAVVNDVVYYSDYVVGGFHYRSGGVTALGSAGLMVGSCSDGTRFAAAGEQNGPHFLAGTNPAAPPLDVFYEPVNTGGTWATSVGENGYSCAVNGGQMLLVVPISVGRSLRVYTGSATPLALIASFSTLPSPTTYTRSAFVGGSPVTCYTTTQLGCSLWNGASWVHAPDVGPGMVENLDLVTRGGAAFLTYAAGGQIHVKSLWGHADAGSLELREWAGPTGLPSWNQSLTCAGSSPEAFAARDALYVAWDESCAAGAFVPQLCKVE
jgi:hypothetical protein